MSGDPLADFDEQILRFLEHAGVDSTIVQLSVPPQREFGERATNVAFRLARERKQSPKDIASELSAAFDRNEYPLVLKVEQASGFLNFFLDYGRFLPHLLQCIDGAGRHYGRRPDVELMRIVVEHTSVNPNKEWHVGHLRNVVLGDVLGRVLRLAGHEVEIQNYIDDTGMQAAQAICGLQDFPEQEKPGEKFDHYAGRHYVKIAAELGAEAELNRRLQELEASSGALAEHESAEIQGLRARLDNIQRLKRRVLDVMHQLESGEYFPIIERILRAQLETAYRLGAFYDLLNWESHLVQSHLFDEAVQRLERSDRVSRPAEGRYKGALVIQTAAATDKDEEKYEVLIRSSGLPTYVGKDIAYHLWKLRVVPDRLRYRIFQREPNGQELWSTALHGDTIEHASPDGLINVIAVDQTQAQVAVKQGIAAAGFEDAAERIVHLAYGLVTTPEGKLSGRRGAISGDGVIEQAVSVALERVRERRSEDLNEHEMSEIAEAVGIGAVRYFLVQYNPLREIVFKADDVVSYDGNTGLYVQYALVRTFAILRKATDDQGIDSEQIAEADASLLQHEQERRLAFHLAQYPTTVTDAARTRSVNLIAEFAFDLATIFNGFYRDCQVLGAPTAELRDARLRLVRTVRDVLSNACGVLGVPVIERL